MTTLKDVLVYGERIGDLMPALMATKQSMTLETDGMYSSHVEFEPEVWRPFRRAIMRAEAELMREDADQLGSPGYEDRTYEQRRPMHLSVLRKRPAQRHRESDQCAWGQTRGATTARSRTSTPRSG
jgi:hypothetical protein